MPTYSYKTKNNSGRVSTGTLQADSREKAIAQLKQKGEFILHVDTANKVQQGVSVLEGRYSVRERALFTRQLATLLKAGMRLSLALQSLSNQMEGKKWKIVTNKLHQDIESSCSLSEAMAKHPRVFPPAYTAIISVAEETGTLAEALNNLSKQLKSQASVSANIRSALTYPIFLLVIGGAIVVMLVTFVIPKFAELFVNAEQALPLPTRMLIGGVETLKHFWWLFVLVIFGLLGSFILGLKEEHFRHSIDRLLLRLPLLGRLIHKLQWARFARIFGSLLAGGVRIVPAIGIVGKATTNRAFLHEVAAIQECVSKGMPLAQAIKKQQHFSEIMTNMVAVGEETGSLSEMLLEVADIYDQESELAIGVITNLLGPILIVILGLIIGFVVLAILLPVFEASSMIA